MLPVRRPRTARLGFTLLELTFVLVALVLLMALLLPAIDGARNAARRSACSNNLRQLGIALHHYQVLQGRFPPGITSHGEGFRQYTGDASTGGVTGLTLLLPFLEQSPLYDRYDFSAAPHSEANGPLIGTVVDVYVCPSNPDGSETVIPARDDLYEMAGTDYVFNAGGNAFLTTLSPLRPDPAFPREYQLTSGPFNVNFGASLAEITDGSSSTLLMGEGAWGVTWSLGVPRYGGGGVSGGEAWLGIAQGWAMGWLGNERGGTGSVFAVTAHDAWMPRPGHLPLPTNGTQRWLPHPPVIGPCAVRGTLFPRSYYDGIESTEAGGLPPLPELSVSPFRGPHQRGINFLFADGHVDYLDENIDEEEYVALSTPWGSEIARARGTRGW